MKRLLPALFLAGACLASAGEPAAAAAAARLAAAVAAKPRFPAAPEPETPLAELAAYARARDIPLSGIEPGAPGSAPRTGDAVTALVTLREGKSLRQWLTEFRIADSDEKEKAQRTQSQMEMTFNGHKFTFSTTASMVLDIRTIGPFVPGRPSPGKEERARAQISPDFLALGLDEAVKSFMSLTAGTEITGSGTGSTSAPGESAAAKPTQSGTTPDSKEMARFRNAAGMFPALMAFFGAAEKTPGLREILWEIAEKPSLWSIVARRGIGLGIGLDRFAVSPRKIPGAEVYEMDLSLALNDKPSLEARFIVAPPRPPLLATAGIVGILARPPDTNDKLLEIRILSARTAP